MTPAAGLAADLIASDVRYFELGARIEAVAGARLAWMPELADLPAACVVVAVDGWRDGSAAGAIETLEGRVAEVGGTRVRLYLEGGESAVTRVLAQRGYRSRREDAIILPRRIPRAGEVTLEPVEDESGWERKTMLHRESPDTPDGHASAPDRWVELERRKARTGGLVSWLIRLDGTVAGAAGTMEQGGVLRLKNLLVHRDLRRRGIATAAIAAFGIMAEEKGRTLGFFGVQGTAGAAVYRSCGMEPLAPWMEWLGPPIGDRGPVPGPA